MYYDVHTCVGYMGIYKFSIQTTACHSLRVNVREQPQGFFLALNLWEPDLFAQHYVQPEIPGKSLLPLPSPLLVEALELQVHTTMVRFQVRSRNSNPNPLPVLVHVYFILVTAVNEGFLTWIGLYSVLHFKIYIGKNPVWWQWFTW